MCACFHRGECICVYVSACVCTVFFFLKNVVVVSLRVFSFAFFGQGVYPNTGLKGISSGPTQTITVHPNVSARIKNR
jgi:hypothetical protein